MAVRTVCGTACGSNRARSVLVICNPVTEEIGALMRIEAEGDGAYATLAVISERESHGGRAADAGRRRDGRGRRGPGADDPVALPHRRPQGRQRGRGADRDACPASPRRCSPG